MTLTRLTVPQAAARLGVSERTVWRRIRSGSLRVERAGRNVLVEVGSAYPDAGARGSANSTRESLAEYGHIDLGDPTSSDTRDIGDFVGVWPYTVENVDRQRRALRARREAAFKEMERLAALTRPDPEGLTGVDYLRDLRDPDWEPVEEDR